VEYYADGGRKANGNCRAGRGRPWFGKRLDSVGIGRGQRRRMTDERIREVRVLPVVIPASEKAGRGVAGRWMFPLLTEVGREPFI
jgi:hypothetical protein